MRESRLLNIGKAHRIFVKITSDGKAVFSSRSRTTWKKFKIAVDFQRSMKIDRKLNHIEITVTEIYNYYQRNRWMSIIVTDTSSDVWVGLYNFHEIFRCWIKNLVKQREKNEDDGPKKSNIFGARTALVERAGYSQEQVSGKMAFWQLAFLCLSLPTVRWNTKWRRFYSTLQCWKKKRS